MDFRDQVRASIDIVRVIGEYVPLKRLGSTGRYVGLCPFHTEKTPSFSVRATHQFYKCFGCDASGDAFKFVMEMEGVSFYEALKLLAERNGVPIPKKAEYSDPESKLRAGVQQMHEIAAGVFQANLSDSGGAAARAYLAGRGVSSDTAAEFGLGLSDRTGNTLLRKLEKEGFPPDLLEASGLVFKREGGGLYDRFRGRLMFPIHNESGKVIGFGGRALADGDEPKYLNSPETAIYHKSHVLYNLHRAKTAIRKLDRTVLVEGYMDVIGLYSAGIHQVVASCGTALTPLQVKTMRRHSNNLVVNFDPDAAGSNATERSLQLLLDENMRISVLELDEDLDPDEYIKRHGLEDYCDKLDRAPGYFYWLADRVRKKFDVRTNDGRIAGFQVLLPAIQRIPDKLERVAAANDIASYLGVEAGLVLEHFRKSAQDRRDRPMAAPQESVRPVESILLNSLILSQEARERVIPALREMRCVEQFGTAPILRAIFSLYELQPEFTFIELEGRLDDKDKTLLARLIFADDLVESSFSGEQALACLRNLQAAEVELQGGELRARVRSAERAGNLQEALRLTEELNRIVVKRKPAGS